MSALDNNRIDLSQNLPTTGLGGIPRVGPGRLAPRALSADVGAIFIPEKGLSNFMENRFLCRRALEFRGRAPRSENVYRAGEHPAMLGKRSHLRALKWRPTAEKECRKECRMA